MPAPGIPADRRSSLPDECCSPRRPGRRDVLGELRTLPLEGRVDRRVPGDRVRDHVDAASEHATRPAGDVLDALTAPGEIVLGARQEVRSRDACAIIAPVGEDVLCLGPKLVFVEVGDRRDAPPGGRVGRDIVNGLAPVEDLTAVAQAGLVVIGPLQERGLACSLGHSPSFRPLCFAAHCSCSLTTRLPTMVGRTRCAVL